MSLAHKLKIFRDKKIKIINMIYRNKIYVMNFVGDILYFFLFKERQKWREKRREREYCQGGSG